jgi:site-specific DNA-methyltransferase (adenine-specific)
MTPYYQDDHVTLYHARWEDVPPDLLRADVLVTDPPYGIGYSSSSSRSILAVSRDHPPIEGDTEPFDPAPLLSMRLPSVMWGANHYGSRMPDSPTWMVWYKREPGVSNDSADAELAWSNLGGPARVFHHRWMGMLRDSERDAYLHPTQKPVALMRWVIEKCPPGTILDPYAGSGTTLVAAKSLGRKAIGVECVERYCEVAASRLRQEVLGLTA